jgi:uracil-DNA glycosylase family 4
MGKAEELESLYAELRSLNHIELKELSKNLVPGEGNLNSSVVLVGEAPGRDEDKKGEPFVGAAGILLTETLESVGMKRSELYVTNVVKRRPPGNRPPRKGEIEVFLPYLRRELEIIHPKIVCLLGATAVKAILGRSLRDVRGRVVEDRWKYLCTYHPAAIIYNPSVERVFLEDMRRLKEILDKTEAR